MEEFLAVVRKWTAEKNKWAMPGGIPAGSSLVTHSVEAMETLTNEFISACSVNGTPHPSFFESVAELAQMAKTQVGG